jgi:hypothetical protein
VGEVQTGHVHTGQAHLGEDFLVLAGRADGADDLGFTHGASSVNRSYVPIVFGKSQKVNWHILPSE